MALLSVIGVSAQKIEGKVFDKTTRTPISDGEVTFFNEQGGRILTVYTSDKGMYSFEPKSLKDIFKVSSSAKGYNSAEVLVNQVDKGFVANFGLVNSNEKAGSQASQTIDKVGASAEMSYFYYDFNSSFLTDANKVIVDEVIVFMKSNPEAKVRVHVYVDVRGNLKYDEWLSERRVERVVNYMVLKGIAPSRLLKWVEKVSTDVAPKSGDAKGGSELRRCDFDLIKG